MKVARAANSAGCQVWKVFVSPDFSVNLEIYRSEFDRIANSCLLPNCSPFRHIPVSYYILIRALRTHYSH